MDNQTRDKQETSIAESHDWQPDGNMLKFESHPGGEALHVHTTCTKCGARAWFLEYQWEMLSKGCASSEELWPQAGTFHCACIFNRAEDFGIATLVKACAYHARREEALSARGDGADLKGIARELYEYPGGSYMRCGFCGCKSAGNHTEKCLVTRLVEALK